MRCMHSKFFTAAYLREVPGREKNAQTSLHDFGDCRARVPPHGLDALRVEHRHALGGALKGKPHIALLGQQGTGQVHLLHLQRHRGRVSCCDSCRDCVPDPVCLFPGPANFHSVNCSNSHWAFSACPRGKGGGGSFIGYCEYASNSVRIFLESHGSR